MTSTGALQRAAGANMSKNPSCGFIYGRSGVNTCLKAAASSSCVARHHSLLPICYMERKPVFRTYPNDHAWTQRRCCAVRCFNNETAAILRDGNGEANARASTDSRKVEVSQQAAPTSQTETSTSSDIESLQQELHQLRAALAAAEASRETTEARSAALEQEAGQARDKLRETQQMAKMMAEQYNGLCAELHNLQERFVQAEQQFIAASQSQSRSRFRRPLPSPIGEDAGSPSAVQQHMDDLAHDLDDAVSELTAHHLLVEAQLEAAMHLAGWPADTKQQICDQIDAGAPVLGEGGSAKVHAIRVGNADLAVKVMDLGDIHTTQLHHFTDVVTTQLATPLTAQVSPIKNFVPPRSASRSPIASTSSVDDEVGNIMTATPETAVISTDIAARSISPDHKQPPSGSKSSGKRSGSRNKSRSGSSDSRSSAGRSVIPSPHLEVPLAVFLRRKADPALPVEQQHQLCTVWHRRDCDVDQLLTRRAPNRLQPKEVLVITYHTALALLDLANARTAHADVKPPNILVMLGPDGLVQSAHLTDFGSLQYIPAGKTSASSVWNGELGWNWPPEQRTEVVLEACDVWGLAMTYSCLITANTAAAGAAMKAVPLLQDVDTVQSLYMRARDKDVLPEVASDPPQIKAATQLMRRCLTLNAKKRPGLQEIVSTLELLLQSL